MEAEEAGITQQPPVPVRLGPYAVRGAQAAEETDDEATDSEPEGQPPTWRNRLGQAPAGWTTGNGQEPASGTAAWHEEAEAAGEAYLPLKKRGRHLQHEAPALLPPKRRTRNSLPGYANLVDASGDEDDMLAYETALGLNVRQKTQAGNPGRLRAAAPEPGPEPEDLEPDSDSEGTQDEGWAPATRGRKRPHPEVFKHRFCGRCGRPGHNIKTCNVPSAEVLAFYRMSEVEKDAHREEQLRIFLQQKELESRKPKRRRLVRRSQQQHPQEPAPQPQPRPTRQQQHWTAPHPPPPPPPPAAAPVLLAPVGRRPGGPSAARVSRRNYDDGPAPGPAPILSRPPGVLDQHPLRGRGVPMALQRRNAAANQTPAATLRGRMQPKRPASVPSARIPSRIDLSIGNDPMPIYQRPSYAESDLEEEEEEEELEEEELEEPVAPPYYRTGGGRPYSSLPARPVHAVMLPPGQQPAPPPMSNRFNA